MQDQPSGFDQVYATAEASRLLGYKNRHSIWRLVKEGRLPQPLKLSPRRSGWRRSTLEQFLAEREKVAA